MKKTQVNFSFISLLEGGAQLTGYVPDPDNSKSGVTIATGFDLGCRDADSLFCFPDELCEKLSPYLGLKKHEAAAALSLTPLVITADEAELIDMHSKADMLHLLKTRYNKVSRVPFYQLPEQAQTVIASVAFQYGNLERRCPNFYKTAISQNWKQMLIELRNFGDRYATRRNREADYLGAIA